MESLSPIREESTLLPVLTSLAACLCSELEAAGFTMCFCGLMPGGDVPLDFCGGDCDTEGCGGQAWVRVVSVFATVDFPTPSSTARCGSNRAATIEIGHAQCAPMPDSNGTPPGVQEQYNATYRQMASMDAMWRTLACCFGADREKDHVIGEYTPMAAGGGCLAAVWTVTVEL